MGLRLFVHSPDALRRSPEAVREVEDSRGTRASLTAVTTIEQLERDVWPDPGREATSLVRRCSELRRKPLAEFTVEDLRIMLGQGSGVSALLPLAVQVLLRDPLAEGDYYPGDLLANVLRLPDSAWSGLRTERERLRSVLAELVAGRPSSDAGPDPRDPDQRLRGAIRQFLGDESGVPASGYASPWRRAGPLPGPTDSPRRSRPAPGA
ncbi:contact-dependent growth inhibition system immunity protein [Micromonospora sp. WMMA1949]|uniref:contact-dependent growth inhibition system immunity protein n=1 Tax=unclassified Micromonospora TaxID=2617518 RepID=UPI0022B71A02|nr:MULTISPECIES: contact-dependent growth inhibition system immunity protein [unclassified Micromonospora]MCZ7427798.1 contact-dependent growth inhibition system immunity protein [Micromonospora sp. WMMA1949]WBC12234.1 contact-dependent growth inhibition system immunity protein [Micromonospora sp. WMMA1947]